jgi:hypothetical protein
VSHAAFLALDRLGIRDAATTLSALQAAPKLMLGGDLGRANLLRRSGIGGRFFLKNGLQPRIILMSNSLEEGRVFCYRIIKRTCGTKAPNLCLTMIGLALARFT